MKDIWLMVDNAIIVLISLTIHALRNDQIKESKIKSKYRNKDNNIIIIKIIII